MSCRGEVKGDQNLILIDTCSAGIRRFAAVDIRVCCTLSVNTATASGRASQTDVVYGNQRRLCCDVPVDVAPRRGDGNAFLALWL